jgi:tetratricopeptide (TPR) repeat protein
MDTAEAAANWRSFLVSGNNEAGRKMLEPVLAAEEPASGERAICFYADGVFLFRLGENAASRERCEQALAIAREAGDAESESLALVGLSRAAFREGQHDEVVRLARDARKRAASVGREAEAAPLHMQAAGTRLLGALDDAAELYRESLELARSLGNERGIAMEEHNLGHVELRRGNIEEAERLFAARRGYADTSADPYEQAMTALNEAALAAARREVGIARERFAETRRLLEEKRIALDPDDAFEFDALATRFG